MFRDYTKCLLLLLIGAQVACNESLTDDVVQATSSVQAPVINSITTQFGSVGDTIVISGKNFASNTTVLFGGNAAEILFYDSANLKVVVPDGRSSAFISLKNGYLASNDYIFNYAAKYSNAVFKPVMADPSVMKDPVSGKFYAYGTADTWPGGTAGIFHNTPIISSIDLVSWKFERDAFTATPNWKNTTGQGVWAPDVNYINGQYVIYHALSAWQDVNPGIGVATSPVPAGPFADRGKLFLSSEVNVRNSIDPTYFEDGAKKYLFWGSYNNGAPGQTNWGTFVTELTDDGLAVKYLSKITKVAASDFEAVMIHKRGNYYYFFGSKGGCCAGAASNYQVRVARSTSLFGPYLDKSGVNIATNNGAGTLVLASNDSIAGPGHNAKIITDKKGTDWMVYHAMQKSNATAVINATTTVNLRALFIDPIVWDSEGWPVVNNGSPSYTLKTGPFL